RPVEAETVRHDDEQSLLVDEAQLDAEELRVRLRFAPEGRDRAEVVVAEDDGDADLEPSLVRGGDRLGQRMLLRGCGRTLVWNEDALHEQVVARGVAVGARRLR